MAVKNGRGKQQKGGAGRLGDGDVDHREIIQGYFICAAINQYARDGYAGLNAEKILNAAVVSM